MGRTIAATAALTAASLLGAAALAIPSHSGMSLHPGDKLAYDFAMEIQIHLQPASHSSQPPVNADTTVQGGETVTVLRADRDGSLHAKVDLSLQMRGNGHATPLNRTLLVKIGPDQSMTVEAGGDQSLAQYLSGFASAQKTFAGRTLRVGDVFHQSMTVPGALPTTITTTLKVVAEKQYRGYPTFAIQATGVAPIDTTIEGHQVKGQITTAGTTYYDQRDQLFVGWATRANADADFSGAQGGHFTTLTTASIVLRSLSHGAAPTAAPSASASPASSASPSASPAPSPSLAPATPGGYYTPPPPSPTPAPLNPYPPVL
jgi:hypothetical protein